MGSRVTAKVHVKSILALAAGLRLAVILLVLFAHPRGWVFSNAPDLCFLAESLRSGQGLSSPFGGSTGPTAFLAPGYPAVLAVMFRLFGSYSWAAGAAIMALQLLFSVLTVAVMLHLTEKLFGAAAANLAGTFWAVSMPLLWLPAVLWDTSLSILLLLGLLALALRVTRAAAAGYWAAMGVYCGMAMLVNPSLTLALFALVGWAVYQAKPRAGYAPGLCLLTLLTVFAPWPLRNARVLHAFIPLRSNFGYEVWQGNHTGGSGVFDASLEPLKNKEEYRDYAEEGEVAYMHNKATLAKQFIRQHPDAFLRLSVGRVARFWSGAGEADNSAIMEGHAVITSLLGLAGLGALWTKRRATAMLFLLPILIFPLPYYVTHADFRFRLILDPVLTMLSAYTLLRVTDYWQSRREA